jgi:hypothetical protein
MTDERTTVREFHDAGGVDDWRVLYWAPGPTSRTMTKSDLGSLRPDCVGLRPPVATDRR